MQRYFSNLKQDNYLILTKEDLYHIKTVMRMKQGDNIEVVYDHKLHICQLDNDQALIKEVNNQITDKKVEYILCVPLLQEQKMSFVLQKATELGVDKISPILTTRCVVKIKEQQEHKLNRWYRICKEASEQSKRLDIPFIEKITKIEDLKLSGFKIVLSTKEKDMTIKKVLKNNLNCDKIIMVVGPEGGLTDQEEKALNELGFVSVTLGQNIMRVETVPICLLSILNYELME